MTVAAICHCNINTGQSHGFNIESMASLRKISVPSDIIMGAIKTVRAGVFFTHDRNFKAKK